MSPPNLVNESIRKINEGRNGLYKEIREREVEIIDLRYLNNTIGDDLRNQQSENKRLKRANELLKASLAKKGE